MAVELYIHIPFCVKKCHYCDFLSFPAKERIIEQYCLSLEEEIRRTAEYLFLKEETGETREVSTVFVGGGTPSILGPEQLRRLFLCIRRNFLVAPEAEVSLEANPGTLTWEKLKCCREAGVNRISIGLQSADDACLRTLGRIHTWKEFEKNYYEARKAGFANINIDIMSGLPAQTFQGYVETLKTVAALEPEHISSYSLILEEGTPFYSSKEIRRQLPDEDTDRKMYEFTKYILSEKGYERYEISNYAREGFACRHNLGYWDGVSYLGLGLGASSYYNNGRFSNERNLQDYLKHPFIPFEKRKDYCVQSREEKMEDYMIFGLRKRKGVSLTRFEKEFFVSAEEIYGNVIKRYENMGFLEKDGDYLRLTDSGIDVSNRIFEEFLL